MSFECVMSIKFLLDIFVSHAMQTSAMKHKTNFTGLLFFVCVEINV